MRLWILFACISLSFVCSPSATSQTWRIGDDQPFPTHITSLPVERQRSILAHLQPSLTKLVQEYSLNPEEVSQEEKSLLVREVPTASGPLLIVQSWGMELCGGVGNCAIWVLGNDCQVLLWGGGNVVTILRAVHHGKPSILISAHNSASDSDLVWYRFDGSRYRPASCAIKSYLKRTFINPNARPEIEHLPCSRVIGEDFR